MKIWSPLPFALLLLAGAALAAEPPSRIAVQAPRALAPGEESRLIVSLTGARGKPVPASQDLQIEIQGAEGTGAPSRVKIPAGATQVEVPIHAPKPGLWQVEASSPGLASGFGVVVCAAKVPRAAVTPSLGRTGRATAEQPSTKPSDERSTWILRRRLDRSHAEIAPPPPPPPEPHAGVAPEGIPGTPESTAAPASPAGHVELIAQPLKPRRGRGGWEDSRVTAFWFQGDEPATSPANLNLNLVVQGGSGETRVAPTVLSIPNGELRSADATISARRADTARVEAWYPGGRSKPVEIDFLAAEPTRLGFVGAPRPFRGLTSVATDLYVRLLDDDDEPVVTGGERKVTVAVQGPTGTRSYSATVPAGDMQARVPVELNRPGTYSVLASAPGLRDSAPLEVRFALDWLLLASSLVGGVLGSLTRVLYRRERVWPKGIARVLALGVASALLVLLLALFGVLSVLGDALPAAGALEKVSATSLFGALLLGFIAGLVFDKILGRFLGGTPGGRRARPKGGAPAQEPKQAPA